MKPIFSHQTWSSKNIFLLAAIGSAVGLGNIWKFPYTAGVSGGAAFVFVYLLALIGFALPIVIAELLIGRRGKQSPPNSMRAVAVEAERSPSWSLAGWLGVAVAVIILPLYCMVAGWSLAFIPRMFSSAFQNGSPLEVAALHASLVADPVEPAIWQGLFMLATALIVSFGLKNGIERAVKFMMPVLFIMLLGLVVYAAIFGEFLKAVTFLFNPDFSKITPPTILAAIGQAFFSVNVGVGVMITFGAYLKQDINIPKVALTVVLVDTFVALIAGLMIFPLVFSNGLDPAEGPGLLFVTLPLSFQQMSGGDWLGASFFIMLFFAALTSTISVLEVPVAWAEEKKGVSRKTSAFIIAAVTWVAGLVAIFSFNILSDFHPLGWLEAFKGDTLFNLMDYFSFDIFLPLSGLAIALFVGWMVPEKILFDELQWSQGRIKKLWYFSVKYLCPVAILAVFISNIF